MHYSKLFILSLIVIIGLSSCSNLPPIREETFILQPVETASIFGNKQRDTFGVCYGLDGRGTQLYLWNEFIRQQSISVPSARSTEHLAGYEVAIQRGESCHLRVLDTFQAATKFDLSTLPSIAVVSANLRIIPWLSPLDPPYNRGTVEQCSVMMVGQSTEAWTSGIYHIDPVTGAGDGFRPFLTTIPARIDSGPYPAIGRTRAFNFNVTHTVSEWIRGVRANNGFVLSPDLERIMDIYAETDEGGFFCDLGISNMELVVTVAIPDR